MATEAAPADRPWWRDAVFYAIYPRSFADANGDGSGDEHVDHPQVYAYVRADAASGLCTVLNFSDEPATLTLPEGMVIGSLLAAIFRLRA